MRTHGPRRNPKYNKGLAFSDSERDRLYLRGLLPPVTLSQEVQLERTMLNIRSKASVMDKYVYLQNLQVRERWAHPLRRSAVGARHPALTHPWLLHDGRTSCAQQQCGLLRCAAEELSRPAPGRVVCRSATSGSSTACCARTLRSCCPWSARPSCARRASAFMHPHQGTGWPDDALVVRQTAPVTEAAPLRCAVLRPPRRYGLMFKSVPRALFITLEDRGRVFRILKNWPERNIKLVRR